jgi:arylsulfatase A-like enzyme
MHCRLPLHPPFGQTSLGGAQRILCLAFSAALFLTALTASENCLAQDSPAPPSVILISIDTLRADHLSSYGYTKIRTPQIDSFAQGGTIFTQAETQIPLTLPSHTVLFTSTYPFENRVEENGEQVPAGTVTLASILRSHGYKTAAFIGSEFLDPRLGLDQGFDDYDCPFARPASGEGEPLAMNFRRDGVLVVRAARQWMEAHRGQPVFVFIHLFDVHSPYTLPPEVARQKGISRYDAQLESVDQVLGHFRQDLIQEGWWDKSLVVLFGDHGEGLGEHQETDHGYYTYESTLHVPLIVHWPRAPRDSKIEDRNSKIEGRNSKIETGNSKIETGNSPIEVRNWESGSRNSAQASNVDSRASNFERRIASFDFRVPRYSSPVGLIDIAPTILDCLHIPAPASFEGRSLMSALKLGEPGSVQPVYSESLYAHDAFRWSPLRVLRVGKYKYIQAPQAELYDLEADPHEHVNLLNKNAAMAAELQNELAAVLARYAPSGSTAPSALSPETLAQLESLGYLAAQPRTDSAGTGPGAPLPDPKDRFAEFQNYETAFIAFAGGHTSTAMPQFQAILNSDPQNTLARFHLGECYLRLKRNQDALREWTTALKFDPQYAPAAEAIGQYWLNQSDYEKARLRFQQVVALTPESSNGHFLLAVSDEHLGRLPEARRHLEIACKIAPHDEGCARELKSLPQK